MKKLFLNSFNTKWGRFHTASTKNRLVLITLPGDSQNHFEDRLSDRFNGYAFEKGGEVNKQIEKEIKSYVYGKLKQFTVKFDIHAAPFQKVVLNEVARIPYGKTRTYGEIAALVGNPKASRAVGTANANNNLPLIIPCHRVLASNGIGGYGGGLELKRMLLRHEGIQL